MALSYTEKALYDELVVWLAVRMTRTVIDLPSELRLPYQDGLHTKGCIIEHGFLSAFEAACGVLLGTRAVFPLNSDRSPKQDAGAWSAYFRLEFDIPELREHLRQPLPPTAPGLAEVLKAFLMVATEYENVRTRRSPFVVPKGFEHIFALLVICGYVERRDEDLVRWTERVAPQMQAFYEWPKEAPFDDDD